jgi:hypothetical protein
LIQGSGETAPSLSSAVPNTSARARANTMAAAQNTALGDQSAMRSRPHHRLLRAHQSAGPSNRPSSVLIAMGTATAAPTRFNINACVRLNATRR